jgi:hypothetical protein
MDTDITIRYKEDDVVKSEHFCLEKSIFFKLEKHIAKFKNAPVMYSGDACDKFLKRCEKILTNKKYGEINRVLEFCKNKELVSILIYVC